MQITEAEESMGTIMKIGLFGGTFSPPHNGHVRAAKLFIKAAKLDRLIVMPAGIPPHKETDTTSSHRLAMSRLAFSDFAEVSDFEINKSGKSYTVETLEWLHGHYPEDELYMLIGEDMFLTFDTWKNPGRIARLATVTYMRRSSRAPAAMAEKLGEYETKFGKRFLYIGEDPTVVSSTEIRERASEGKEIYGLVPDAVCRYITDRGLYKR